jgi:hypothetical protein
MVVALSMIKIKFVKSFIMYVDWSTKDTILLEKEDIN